MSLLLECYVMINKEPDAKLIKIVENEDEHDYLNYVIVESAGLSQKIKEALENEKYNFKLNDDEYRILKYEIYDKSFCIVRKKLTFDFTNKHKIHDIYLYDARCKCDLRDHNVLSATAFVKTKASNNIPLNVDFCATCNKHYISKVSLSLFENKYGKIHYCNIEAVSDFNDVNQGNDSYSTRNKSSILFKLGYNVSRKDSLSKKERTKILIRAIEEEYLKKNEIIDHLEFLIKDRSNNPSMRVAISKWKEDLFFVNNYKIENQNKVSGRIKAKR